MEINKEKLTVVLSNEDQEIAKEIAKKRYESNRKAGVTNSRRGTQSDETIELNGIGAEIAVARYLGLNPDLTISPRRGGYDLITPSGKTIDVKTTMNEEGDLLVLTHKKLKDADTYLFTVGTFPVFRLVGIAKNTDIIDDKNKGRVTSRGQKLNAENYILSQEQLYLFTGKE